MAPRGEDIITIFTSVVTRGEVVADGEWERPARVDVSEAVAHHSSAADVGGALPNDLGEVTPLREIGHAGVGLSVGGGKVFNLVVVHQVGEHDAHLACLDTIADVLSVITAVNGTGMTLDGF